MDSAILFTCVMIIATCIVGGILFIIGCYFGYSDGFEDGLAEKEYDYELPRSGGAESHT